MALKYAKLFVTFSSYGYMWGYVEYQPPYISAPGGLLRLPQLLATLRLLRLLTAASNSNLPNNERSELGKIV